MTVAKLHEILGKLIEQGHGETDIIAHCDDFNAINKNRVERYFIYLDESDVYYQSGDIELGFRNYNIDEES